MKKWYFLIILFMINVLTIVYVISNNYVTFAKVYPKNISFDISNYLSVKNAILTAYYDALEKGREFFGKGSFILSWLVVLNFLVVIFLNFKCIKREKE